MNEILENDLSRIAKRIETLFIESAQPRIEMTHKQGMRLASDKGKNMCNELAAPWSALVVLTDSSFLLSPAFPAVTITVTRC